MFKTKKRPVYLVLLHYPIQNRKGEKIVTSVTNLDIHDIARSARTYGILQYFLVTPVDSQHELVGRILSHWNTDQSKSYHPDRFEALSRVKLVKTLEGVIDLIQETHVERPEVVMTDARALPKSVSFSEYRKEIEDESLTKPILLILGTGWGVDPSLYPMVDRILVPIYGPEGEGGYNHLSVRAAAAVILDRLLGQ